MVPVAMHFVFVAFLSAPLQLGLLSDRFRPKKHVCIFELERQNGTLTGYVVCGVCGAKPGSPDKASAQDRPEN